MTTRSSNAVQILGKHLHERLSSNSNVLCVGAGGIGCELLKNLVLTGFNNITLIDLDTIDLSNLNRQFLFQKQHVKKPKSIVARSTALTFNPSVNIEAIHGNIKDSKFSVTWFKQFDIVLNALDNLDARRHVNKMCLAADIPLIESGTAGYVGQVKPILKDQSECYDCEEKPVQKSFPVCTIRSTPSAPIHCIVWSKSYLFPQLFGAEDEVETEEELDKAVDAGENATEIKALKKEAAEMTQIRKQISQEESGSAVKRVFDKVFKKDIDRLLLMEDMWKTRTPPKPISYDEAFARSTAPTNGHVNGEKSNTVVDAPKGLKDQKNLSLSDSFELFVSSFQRLAERNRQAPDVPLSFDKDDDDTLDFVTASANIRAEVFGIASQTRWQVKEMAGNIIAAIATTNAVIAGLIVLQALQVLRSIWSRPQTEKSTTTTSTVTSSPRKPRKASTDPTNPLKQAKHVWLARINDRLLTAEPLSAPNAYCSVCRTPYISISIKSRELKLGEFLEEVVRGKLDGFQGDVSLMEGSRLLFDPDFEDNEEKSFEELGLGSGKMVTVADEEGDRMAVVFLLEELETSESSSKFQLTGPISPIPHKPPPIDQEKKDSDSDDDDLVISSAAPTTTATAAVTTSKTSGTKRKAAEAGLDDQDEPSQSSETIDNTTAASTKVTNGSKRQKTSSKPYEEKEGVIVLDSDDEEENAPSAQTNGNGATGGAGEHQHPDVIEIDSD